MGRVWGLTCNFRVQVEFEVTCKADDICGNKPTLSPVAMVTGAKPQAEHGFLCDDESRGRKKKSSAEENSEASAAAPIELRHYSFNTLVLAI